MWSLPKDANVLNENEHLHRQIKELKKQLQAQEEEIKLLKAVIRERLLPELSSQMAE